MVETILVGGIFILDLVLVIDQLRTSRLQRAYWTERKDYFARKLRQPPKQKGVANETTPEVKS